MQTGSGGNASKQAAADGDTFPYLGASGKMKLAMSRAHLLIPIVLFAFSSPLCAWYKAKEIQIKPAKEYAVHQAFQNLVIAAYPYETEKKTREIFDTKKLHQANYMPILIVIENNNDFAIALDESDILLLDAEGGQESPIDFIKILLQISRKKSKNPYPDPSDISNIKDKKMLADFERKAFREKMIAPHDKDYGVVFYRLPVNGNLEGLRLYLPEIFNVGNDEQLMFFEFELDGIKR